MAPTNKPRTQPLQMSSAVPIAPAPAPLRMACTPPQTTPSSSLQRERRTLPVPPPPIHNHQNSTASNSPNTTNQRTPTSTNNSGVARRTPSPRATADSKPQSNDSSTDKLSPWSMEYEPIPMRAPSRPTMRDLTFTYLWGQKVYRPASGPLASLPSLRWLAKNLSPSVLQEGPKCKLVCRLMLRVEHIVSAGHGSWDNAFEPHRSNYYEILREKYIVRPMYVAPSHSALMEGIPEGRERLRHDRDGKRAIQLIALDTTLPAGPGKDEENESTVDLTADDAPTEARSTSSADPASSKVQMREVGTTSSVPSAPLRTSPPPLLQSTVMAVAAPPAPPPRVSPPVTPLSLTVSEFARLMAAVTRCEAARKAAICRKLWDREITNTFNDSSYRPRIVVPDIQSIDSATPPRVPWDGISLQKAYESVCEIFYRAHAEWITARNAHGGVITPFSTFVNAVCGTNQLDDKGRMVCVMFAAYRCGRPDEFTTLVRGDPRDWYRRPNETPKKRDWKRRKLSLGMDLTAAKEAGAQASAAVTAALKYTYEEGTVGGSCCRQAVDKMVTQVASSAVNAAITSALNSSREEFDVVHTLDTLKKLAAMRSAVSGDTQLPEYVARYIDTEIATLRRRIEAHQRENTH